jgi:hypothetical protein
MTPPNPYFLTELGQQPDDGRGRISELLVACRLLDPDGAHNRLFNGSFALLTRPKFWLRQNFVKSHTLYEISVLACFLLFQAIYM